MPTMTRQRGMFADNGFATGPQAPYTQGESAISFAVGQMIFCRFGTELPQGAIIDAATVKVSLGAKDYTVSQSSTHTVGLHQSGDSPILQPGNSEWGRRGVTAAKTTWTPSWTGTSDSNSTQLSTMDVRLALQEVVNRDDFLTGGYITVMIECTDENTSDMSFAVNNVFLPAPTLSVTYHTAASDERYTINRCENSEFGTLIDSVDGPNLDPSRTSVPLWDQNVMLNLFVDPAVSGGMITKDPTFTRVAGLPTLKFTCGTPAADTSKATGPVYLSRQWDGGVPFVFAGWAYIPASVPTSVTLEYGDVFSSPSMDQQNLRGQWFPFCSTPATGGTLGVPMDRWISIYMKKFQAGHTFWISEPAFFASPFKQMPFNGTTPERRFADHRSSASRQQSVRLWTPKTTMLVSGAAKKMPTWSLRPSTTILELTEPVKGGPEIQKLTSTMTIAGIPAGVTITEL